MYVVYFHMGLQDGSEHWCQMASSLSQVETVINERYDPSSGCNLTARVFELGKELTVVREVKEVQPPTPPPVTKVVYSVGVPT